MFYKVACVEIGNICATLGKHSQFTGIGESIESLPILAFLAASGVLLILILVLERLQHVNTKINLMKAKNKMNQFSIVLFYPKRNILT